MSGDPARRRGRRLVLIAAAALLLGGAALAARQPATRDAPLVVWVPASVAERAESPWVALEPGDARVTPGGAADAGRWLRGPVVEEDARLGGEGPGWQLHRWSATTTVLEWLRAQMMGAKPRVPERVVYRDVAISRTGLWGTTWHAALREDATLTAGDPVADLAGTWTWDFGGLEERSEMSRDGTSASPPPFLRWTRHGGLLVVGVSFAQAPGARGAFVGAAEVADGDRRVEGRLLGRRGGPFHARRE